MPVNLQVKEFVNLPEGFHTGTIVMVEQVSNVQASTQKTFEYVDVYIRVDGTNSQEIKWGAPAKLSSLSSLGKMVSQFAEMKGNQVLDVEKALLDKRVSFVAVNESVSGKGTFSRVADGSIRPLQEAAKAAPGPLSSPQADEEML